MQLVVLLLVDYQSVKGLESLLGVSDVFGKGQFIRIKKTIQTTQRSRQESNNTPVAYVAALNEFGRNARPFIRPAIAENKKDWNSTLNAALKQMLAGNLTPDKAMTILGLQVEGDIKQSIVSGDHAPLSPITLAIRRLKNDGVKINATLVGMVADAVARGETGPGQLGQPSGNTDPLRDTGYMLATITHEVS
jgi:hypothetical protein